MMYLSALRERNFICDFLSEVGLEKESKLIRSGEYYKHRVAIVSKQYDCSKKH